MAHLSDYNTENTHTAQVISTSRFTPEDKEEIREMVLELEDKDFAPEIDQSFGVLVDVNGEYGTYKHHRLYSVADIPEKENGKMRIKMLVKRCNYVDEFSGELQKGVASNYLCNRKIGDKIRVTGPFSLPFAVPEDKTSDLILIGMGTGIAPFRAFIKHIYKNVGNWQGRIRLFYGAKSGLELLYLNDHDGDLTNYYDEETFKAFHALSSRPHMNDPIALEEKIVAHAEETLDMLMKLNTRVYVAGYEKVREVTEKAFIKIMGTEEAWKIRKTELMAGKKWAEVIY